MRTNHLTTMNSRLLAAALAALAASCGPSGTGPAATGDPGVTVITADRVLDGTGAVLEGHGVVVRDGRIAGVVPSAELPPAGRRLDFPGGTILPGLIDTHVHLTWHFGPDGRLARGASPETTALHGLENGLNMLAAGFTTVQSLGSALDGPVRDAVNRGVVPGPRIITSMGQLSANTGGPDELVAAVKDLHERGADAIKIFASESIRVGGGPTLSQEALDAACGAAAELGLRTLVHAHGPESASRASRAGCTTIEHGALLDQATLDLLAANGTFYDPNTDLIFANYFENRDRYLGIGNYTEEGFAAMESGRVRAMETFRMALATEGLKIVFGTDAVAGAHGQNAREAVARAEAGGQDPVAVITGMTSMAATSLGLGEEIGTLAEGYVADLIVVEGDPTQSLDALFEVRLVMRDGRIPLPEQPPTAASR